MKSKIKLSNDEIREFLGIKSSTFPKYTTQLINLANYNAQATRPKNVGQMSELIQEFSGKNIKEWEEWYLKRYPNAIKNATEKIVDMIENFKDAMDDIDQDLIEKWVYDLVIIKTFIGLKFQEAILAKVAQLLNQKYRLATVEEEAQGIDGVIGEVKVSIKPISYKIKQNLKEELRGKIIYYEKRKDDGIIVDFHELL